MAVLASSLTTAVHGATLEDYGGTAAVVDTTQSFTVSDPVVIDPAEGAVTEARPENETVQTEIETVQPAQPPADFEPVDGFASVDRSIESIDESSDSSVEAIELPEESLPEPVRASTTLPSAAVPTTRILSAGEEDAVSHIEVDNTEVDNFDKNLAPLSEDLLTEEIDLPEKPSLQPVGEATTALPTEAVSATRIITPDADFVDAVNVTEVDESSSEETTSTVLAPEVTEPSVGSEDILIAQAAPNPVV
ncbi:MAG: hypothetical protein F6J97_24640, partial [Leptolyngbya sp. SIO4C1]|nr:hypothetical protein [Leptolyngbya sp. SIO4C1]